MAHKKGDAMGDQPKADAATEEKADALRAQMELLQSKLHSAKIAFHNRTELDGKVPEYEDVAAVAKSLIKLNYDLQKLLFGEVRMKLSVARLMRSSNR
jgi:hypothetical protein